VSIADTREHQIAPVREKLFALIDERVAADRAPVVKDFAQAYLRRLAPDAVDEPSVAELFGEINGLFNFADARGADPIAVRACNPTTEEDGYEPHGSVVETNTEDWPFLVDSVSAELQSHGARVQRVLHPIVGVERNGEGRISAVLHPREASTRESVMHFDLD
jgi:glutamate dehydrogenase